MKYCIWIIITMLFIQCIVNKNNGNKRLHNEESNFSHELIPGQWVETHALNRLKERDISEPHPFNWHDPHQDILTCYKDGTPFYLEFFKEKGVLEKREDYYIWMNDDSMKLTFQFSIQDRDTVLMFESQYKSNDPNRYSLSKIPRATPCDFVYYPGIDLRSGSSKCYSQYYFEGDYHVKEIATNESLPVDISSDFSISGLPDFEHYNIYTYGSPLVLKLYDSDTMYSRPITFEGQQYPRVTALNNQYFTVIGQDNGFDLHRTNYSGKGSMAERKFEVLEKVYEFTRK